MTDTIRHNPGDSPFPPPSPLGESPIDGFDQENAVRIAADRLGMGEGTAPAITSGDEIIWSKIDAELGLVSLGTEDEALVDEITNSILANEPEAVEALKEDDTIKSLALQAAVGALALGNDPIGADAEFYKTALKTGVRSLMGKVSESWHTWQERPTAGDKATALIKKTGAWYNLLCVEATALFVQGKLQQGDESSLVSAGVGLGLNLAIDGAVSLAGSMHNKGKDISNEDLLRATAEGFFRGGAMGVDQYNVPPSKAMLPVAGYGAFGLMLAGAAEFNDTAAKLIENPAAGIGLLVGLGLGRIFSNTFHNETMSDKLVTKVLGLINKFKHGDSDKTPDAPLRQAA